MVQFTAAPTMSCVLWSMHSVGVGTVQHGSLPMRMESYRGPGPRDPLQQACVPCPFIQCTFETYFQVLLGPGVRQVVPGILLQSAFDQPLINLIMTNKWSC
jgi:hypothetical protein